MAARVESLRQGRRRGRRRRRIALILGLIVAAAGCGNPFMILPYMLAPDPVVPAKFKLSSDRKETKVVLMAHGDFRPEMQNADADLADRLSQVLRKRFDAKNERVKIVPPSQVRAFVNKQTFPATPYEVGKHFQADYVVTLDISRLTLYVEKSSNTLFQGNAAISVSVADVQAGNDAGESWRNEYTCTFPKDRELEVNGANPATFRGVFLDRVADDMARWFVASEPMEHRMD